MSYDIPTPGVIISYEKVTPLVIKLPPGYNHRGYKCHYDITVLSRLSGTLGARGFGAGYRIAGLTNRHV